MDKKTMLEAIISHYTNGNKAQFAKKLGVTAQTVSAWLSRNTYDVELIYTKCVDLSASWLLTGKGPMLTDHDAAGEETTAEAALGGRKEGPCEASPAHGGEGAGTPLPAATRVSPDDPRGIPLIPVEAMAGLFQGDLTVLDYECERYIIPAFHDADFLIYVKGTSMSPNYSSGDIVACRRVPLTGLFFQWGKVYVIDTSQGPVIKRIKRAADPDHILLSSDNPSFDPFELPVADLHGVALVIGLIRLE